jgi:hypothetical protein
LEAAEEARAEGISETEYDFEAGELKIYYLNERRFQRCPHVKLHIEGHPVIAVVDSGSEATILAQELFDKLENSNTKMLQIPITGAVLISAWGNRTKKIKTQALIPFEMSGGCFEHNCIIAPGMIADCILGADFLEKFEVTISFKHQCMYTKDENGSRQHLFLSEDMSKIDLQEETPLQEISQSNIGVKGEMDRKCC